MARYGTTATSEAPVEGVFDALADFSSVAAWDPGVRTAERLDDGGLRAGARFRVVVEAKPRPLTFEYVITRFERPRLIELEATNTFFHSRDTMRFTRSTRETTVAYEADLTLRGPLMIFDRVLDAAFRRIGDRAAAGLQRFLDDLSEERRSIS